MLICRPLISKESVVIKLSLALVIMTLLISCSSKEQDDLLKEHQGNKNYYKYLQKTEKVQFKENNITKMFVTATYMNKPTIDKDDTSDEVFLVGIFSENGEIESLTSEEFNLTLKEVKTNKELEKEKEEAYKKRKEKRLIAEALGNDVNSSEFAKQKKKAIYLEPLDVKRVSQDNPLLKEISFVSEWNQFYLVRFAHVAGNRLSLKIKSKKSEEQIEMDIEKAKAKAKAEAKLLKKKTATKIKVIKKKNKKKKKIKVPLYHTTILHFAKVAKYAL